jgi:6-pyruvoyltetrahydropterin/6-carboxytetrahydropterin synthase
MQITKVFSDYPAGHRQHAHSGHCSQVHGHDWKFELTFASTIPDDCGFILDFGGPKMKEIKGLLTHLFDHTLLINEADPLKEKFSLLSTEYPRAFGSLRVVPDCSCEGIARLVHFAVEALLQADPELVKRQVVVLSVKVYEDSKNSATSYDRFPVGNAETWEYSFILRQLGVKDFQP